MSSLSFKGGSRSQGRMMSPVLCDPGGLGAELFQHSHLSLPALPDAVPEHFCPSGGQGLGQS